MVFCLASNGMPPAPNAAGAEGFSPAAGAAGAAGAAAAAWAVTTGGGFGADMGAALGAREGDGASAWARGRPGASAPGTGIGGRGTLPVAAASPLLGSGAGRGSGTWSARAVPANPISATAVPSARLAFRMNILRARAPAPHPGGSGRVWRFRDSIRPRAPVSITGVGVLANQDFPLPRMVGGANHSLLFHPLHDGSGTIVPDLQPALNVACGCFAVANHDLHRLLIKIVALAAAHAGRV